MITTKFSELSLLPEMQRAIDERGFVEATAVQAETIPLTRTGVDILAQSQTGTGKTLAFSIPAIERLKADSKAVQVLILSPTRELAQQCAEEIRKLSPYMPHVRTADIFGGSDYETQFRALRKANMVIGTPGRIMDHIRRGTLKLHNLEMIVLDEADEMLNMGFKEDVETILTDAPEDRQTLLFSATVPKSILKIAQEFQKDPVQINVTQNKTVLDGIKQQYVDVPKQHKDRALSLLLHKMEPKRSIIFTNTKSMVDELTQKLCDDGFMAQGLHGDMRQNHRSKVMSSFKGGHTAILVATDVAARGIDVQDIDYVFNYDLPQMTEYYVHRIGRTGRAGRTGTAITLCCGKRQIDSMRALAKKTHSEVEEIEVPTKASIEAQHLERNVGKVRQELAKEVSEQGREIVERLISEGHNAEDLACALLSMAFSANELNIKDMPEGKKKGEVAVAVIDKKSKREMQSNMIVFNIGSSCNCSARHLVGAITEHADISSSFIGKIKIEQNRSIVEIAVEHVPAVLKAMKNAKICGIKVFARLEGDDVRKEKPSRRAPSSRGQTKKFERKGKRGEGSSRSSSASPKKRVSH